MLKGFLYLGVLVVLFFLIRKSFTEQERLEWFGTIYNNPLLVMSIFVGSEVLFGIIPPEIFMLWSLETGWMGPYFLSIGLFSFISYAAGYFNFNLGLLINHKSKILKSSNKYIQKYLDLFKRYGAFMVIVASISPLPFSLISLLGGAAGLDKRKYILNSLFRILRYFVYAYVLWLIQT
ncbi:VTT domain-containing protein [Algoriphagus sp.]|uniref:VTT domain-containing protein n=1 Tax=Algoriphagus sp. TaxID=1872435 RepID=UPI0025C45D8E|nr:VTT domain-containing protein [Algoriphagus sp.]